MAEINRHLQEGSAWLLPGDQQGAGVYGANVEEERRGPMWAVALLKETQEEFGGEFVRRKIVL
jgi:hypothetical protein